MTEKELSQLYFLKKEIAEYQQQILMFETLATKCTSTMSDMPHKTGITDRVGKYGTKIVDIKDSISQSLEKYASEFKRLNDFILNVEDSEIRLILKYRYVDGLSWRKIADKMGESGKFSEEYPRRRHNSFFKKLTKMLE
ncbi:hypothetical protein FACS189465_3520 [Clostridia bacterium]|nr:hypothetical protein FACS189465_3520 [Clostridia bacterium]